MSYPALRSFPVAPTPTDGGTSIVKLTRGMVQQGIVLSVPYSVNVTGAGAAVRTYSMPIRRITLVGSGRSGGDVTLQSWLAPDLIRLAQIFEQTPIGGLLVPASAAAIANYTALEAHVPLSFEQSLVKNGDKFALPTFGYTDLTLTIEWGTVSNLFTTGGALAGTITFTPKSSTSPGVTVTQADYAGLNIRTAEQAAAVARAMPRSIGRYADNTQTAAANTEFAVDLGSPPPQNIRAIMLVAELTSTGEPTNTLVNTVSVKEDNTNFVHTSVPWSTLRARNARRFGVTMPVGVAVMDFAEDGDADIAKIYQAVTRSNVKIVADTAAVAATLRAVVLGIAPPLV